VAANETTLQHFDYGLADAYPLRTHAQLFQSLAAKNKFATLKII